jgi:hypothetical protein
MKREYVSCKSCGIMFETEVDEVIGVLENTCFRCIQDENCQECTDKNCEECEYAT